MTFTKENASALGKKGAAARTRNKETFRKFIVSGAAKRAKEILEDLLNKVQVTKEEKEGLEFLIKLMPYERAKKTDITSNDKELTPLLVKFIKDESNN